VLSLDARLASFSCSLAVSLEATHCIMPPRRRLFPPPSLTLSQPTPVQTPQTTNLEDLTTIPGEKIKVEDVEVLEELGAGAGGSVHRVSGTTILTQQVM
jgi:hypothetical protein